VTSTRGAHGVLLTVAYDGRSFAGFALQREQRTVMGELLGALRELDPTIRELRGASRTDAGVHARGQRVAFDATADISPRGWMLGTLRHLPNEISIQRAAVIEPGYTPRFDSIKKHYRYLLLDTVGRDPFLYGRDMRIAGISHPDALERARTEASLAVGTHDFAAFRSSADTRDNTLRTLERLDVGLDPSDARLVRIDIEGDAFMHNMVRILVGTIVEVARRRLAPGAISRAIASHDRRDAGFTAPSAGLYLERVELHREGYDAWPPGS
jgi:tRNA pseudouridine38-40 synthase